MNIKVGTVYIDVEPDVSQFSDKLRRKLQNTDLGKAVEQTLEKATKSVVKFGKDSDKTSVSLDKIGDRTSNFNNKMLAMRNILKLIKFPAVFAGLGLAAQEMVALAAGAFAVVSAFGPLVGLIVAMPAGLLAIGAAAITVKLAFSGITAALKGTEGAMEKLGPAGQQFTLFLKSLKPLKDSLQDIASSNLLPGIERGMIAAFSPDNIKAAKSIIADTGKSLGDLATKFGAELSNPEWAKALLTIGDTINMAFTKIGNAVIGASAGWRDLFVAAQPLIRWLTDIIAKGIQLMGIWAGNAAASGKAAKFFQETADITHLLGTILGNLFRSLVNIGKAAYPLGKIILVALNEQLAKLNEWTRSAGGQASLSAYFERSLPVLKATVLLLGALAKTFFGIGDATKNSGLAEFLDKIRTEVLPIFQNAVNGASGFGKALSDLIIAAAKLVSIFLSSSGPMQGFVTLLAKIAGTIADLLTKYPLLAQMLVTFIGFYSIFKLFNLSGVIKSIIATVAALQAQSAATGIATTAQLRLNYAMRANIVGIIVTGLQILAVALFLLWKRSETFRNAVKALFSFLRDVGVKVLQVLIGHFKLFLTAVEYILKALSHLPFGWGDKFKAGAEKIEATKKKLDSAIDAFGNLGKSSSKAGEEVSKMASKSSGAIVNLDKVLQGKLRATKESVSRIGQSLSSAFTDFTSKAMKAFDAETSHMLDNILVKVQALGKAWVMKPGDLTPAERELAALNKAEALRQRKEKRKDLEHQLAEAQKTIDTEQQVGNRIITVHQAPDAAKVKDLKKQLRDLGVEDRRAALESRAAVERTAADKAIKQAQLNYQAERDVQKESFQKELTNLQNHISAGKLTAAQARTETLRLLKKYGVDLRQAGINLGNAFSESLVASLKTVQTQAGRTSVALKKVLELRGQILESDIKNTLTNLTPFGLPPGIDVFPTGDNLSGAIAGGATTIGQYVEAQFVSDESTAREIGATAARKVSRR